MRDEDFRKSMNIEDRRGDSGGFGGFGGDSPFGGGGIPVRTGGGFGFIIVIILMLIFGGGNNILGALLGASSGGMSTNGYQSQSANGLENSANENSDEARTADRIARVLGSTEDYWGKYFAANNAQYNQPTLVLFRNQTSSPCGAASGATGPFYCPSDKKVYLDLGFFDELDKSLGANGDFAQAYVVAHEIGHHIQNELGILPKAHKAMAREGGAKGADSISVRIELQADCLAGTWAKDAVADTGALEQGDIEEAINAAQAVGDDRLQKRAQGYAVPDSFTHGTSQQRAKWFAIGMKNGNPEECDTFSAQDL